MTDNKENGNSTVKEVPNNLEIVPELVLLNKQLWEHHMRWLNQRKKGECWGFFWHEDMFGNAQEFSQAKLLNLKCIISAEKKENRGKIVWKKENGSSTLLTHCRTHHSSFEYDRFKTYVNEKSTAKKKRLRKTEISKMSNMKKMTLFYKSTNEKPYTKNSTENVKFKTNLGL